MSIILEGGSLLAPKALEPLRLGEIRPEGWLQQQLRIQAAGLTGHLDQFWPDVAESQWIGGRAEGWERGPYWLDGALPLAYLLKDAELMRRVRFWIETIISNQHPDGWLGPIHDKKYGYPYDPWPVYIIFKALIQYYEVESDDRVIAVMLKFIRRLDELLECEHLRSWARYRWADMVLSIHWLYEHTSEQWLLSTAQKMQVQGYAWRNHYEHFPYWYRTRGEECDLRTHVVNNAMAIKAPGVWYRQSHNTLDKDAARQIIQMLDKYHGQANGMFSGDEHLAGRHPSQGTELCAVVEFMFSLEVLIATLGWPELADRLEMIAFNALPATMSPDMWSHQYDQQVNQVVCCVAEDRIYTSNGPDANIFGLEPHFGCCTANLHQGWPKFVSHLVMRHPDGGLVINAYAPCTVETSVDGEPLVLGIKTDYPFKEDIHITLQGPSASPISLCLRIPSWCQIATLTLDGHTTEITAPGSFYWIELIPAAEQVLTLHLSMAPRLETWDDGSVSVYRGPLLYGLEIGEDWQCIGGEPPHQDWEVYPTTPWNYGLILDNHNIEASLYFEERAVGAQPFSIEGAPVSARVTGAQVSEWQVEHNAAGPLPKSPVRSQAQTEILTLIPYGCTNLRIAQFPVIEKANP